MTPSSILGASSACTTSPLYPPPLPFYSLCPFLVDELGELLRFLRGYFLQESGDDWHNDVSFGCHQYGALEHLVPSPSIASGSPCCP
jgi:hypothetical protein